MSAGAVDAWCGGSQCVAGCSWIASFPGLAGRRVSLCVEVSDDLEHVSLIAAAVAGGQVLAETVAVWSDTVTALDELPEWKRRIRPKRFGWFVKGPAVAVATSLRKLCREDDGIGPELEPEVCSGSERSWLIIMGWCTTAIRCWRRICGGLSVRTLAVGGGSGGRARRTLMRRMRWPARCGWRVRVGLVERERGGCDGGTARGGLGGGPVRPSRVRADFGAAE